MLDADGALWYDRNKEEIALKFLHISDLHLGKRVNGFSMLEDQQHILEQILVITAQQAPAGVLLAGDIYDKSVPSAEAVQLFDWFLVELIKLDTQVFVISGNHDSPERIAFGGRLMDRSGVHVSPVYGGAVEPILLQDAWGTVAVWLLPFIKPVNVRRWLPETEIGSYTDALAEAVKRMNVDPSVRNVLVTHQFVTGAARSESEELSVGGSDNVDAWVFEPFDYVALGHLHGPQQVERETIRYCGTPLKYSFSEVNHKKSVTVVELLEKGDVRIDTVPLIPLREMRQLRGSYAEVTAGSYYGDTTLQEDYLHITLTDEEDIPDAITRLRSIYRGLMKLEYDNARTGSRNAVEADDAVERKTPLELFSAFYTRQNNRPPSPEQNALLQELIETIWEGDE